MPPFLPAPAPPFPPQEGRGGVGFFGGLDASGDCFESRRPYLERLRLSQRCWALASASGTSGYFARPAVRNYALHEEFTSVDAETGKIEVIQVRGRKSSTPSPTQSLPTRAEERPNFGSRD